MNKNEFLNQLKRKLEKLPKAELESAISYYEEYFQDANIGEEVDVTLEFGSPSQIASEILADYASKTIIETKEPQKNPLKSLWFIILAVFAAPIGLPLAFAAVVTIGALIFAAFMIVFAFGLAAIAFVFAGIVMLIASLTVIVTDFATALLVGGMALLFLGGGMLLTVGIVYLFNLLVKGIVTISKRFLTNSSRRVKEI